MKNLQNGFLFKKLIYFIVEPSRVPLYCGGLAEFDMFYLQNTVFGEEQLTGLMHLYLEKSIKVEKRLAAGSSKQHFVCSLVVLRYPIINPVQY